MTSKWTVEEIRAFWDRQAREHQQSPAASWSDVHAIDLEVRQILKYLADGDAVLDAGCANGYSTIQIASQKTVRIRGLDYTPEMIRQANARLHAFTGRLAGEVSFAVGDLTDLPVEAGTYDKVVVIRVLINLRDWSRQRQALAECARVLRPGGLLLLSEASLQGWHKLNAFRREWALPDIPMPEFNDYIDEQKFLGELPSGLNLVEVVDFASTYYVMTRLLKPLLVKALGADASAAAPEMEWNRWAAQLPAWGDYGTQKLFIFEKQR
jgi:ubiquinone/menaquinone biosynthesis C-methylase UbiE